MSSIPLQGLTPTRLTERFPGVSLAEARSILSRVFRDLPHSEPMSQVRRTSTRKVAEEGILPTLTIERHDRSSIDPFEKWLLRADDGECFETVRIPLERAGRFSVCVSSQVGCALGCRFCATGRLGLRRNLETWEIIEQIRIVRRSLLGQVGARVHGLVFQGMGEPLANLDRVLAAIAVATEPSGLAIDGRAITVCTAGLPAGIRRLALEAPRVRLGISICSARAITRRRLMPIDGAHPFPDVFDAAVDHAKTTGLSPMFAVTLLEGENDGAEDARAMGEMVRRFQDQSGKWPRVSIVPYNAIAGEADDPFRRSAQDREQRFRDVLREGGVFTHKRYSGGGDVQAACGQLAAGRETPLFARKRPTAGA